MIVFHSFFYKKHPKYLERAVGMLRNMNNCCFINNSDLDVFIKKLRETLEKDSGGRYEKREVSLYVGKISPYSENGQLQIEVKGGLDYAARIDYIKAEKGFLYGPLSGERILGWIFTADGNIIFQARDSHVRSV